MISQQNTWGPSIKYRVHVRIRGFEKLVFRKILRTYFMDDPLLYCFITISLSLENLNFVRKEVMLSWRIFKILDFKMAPSCKRRPVDFLGNFWSRFRIFWMLSFGWRRTTTVDFIDICCTFTFPKFGHQTWNCPFIRHFFLANISPILLLCEKHQFCGKLDLSYFYPPLRSLLSSFIHTGVKRIFYAYCLDHLKNMVKCCKTQLWEEIQYKALFRAILSKTKLRCIARSLANIKDEELCNKL